MPPEAVKFMLRPEHSNGRIRLLIVVAMVLGTVRLFEATPLSSANDRSRWATVYSLVHHHTFRIDEIRKFPGWDTIDKVRIKEANGEEHYYSSKPPMFTTLVAGGYLAIQRTLGWTIDPNDVRTVRWISVPLLFLINIVPSAIALTCLATIVWRHCEISFTRSFLLACACFATLWSAYLPSLNNHTPALCCVMIALRCAIATVPGHLSSGRLAAAGFLSGLAVTFELPALAFLGGLGVILLKQSPKRTLLLFVPAAVAPLAAYVVANKVATGDWAPVYASYNSPDSPYRYLENGVPSYWMEPKGLDKAVDAGYTYLFHCTLGHHGIFSLTPIFLLSFLGVLRFRKWQFSALAPYHLLGALLTVVVLGFYMLRHENWNYGGVSVGLRWMVWLIPFWLLMMAPAVDLFSGNRLGQTLLMVLIAPSVFSAWHPFDAPWKQPWIFQALDSAGRLNQYREKTPAFEHVRRSWISQLPASAEADPDYWIEVAGTNVEGTPITLRVADGGKVVVAKREGRRVEFRWSSGPGSESVQSLVLSRAVLEEGETGELILWPEGSPAEEKLLGAYELACGVPVWRNPADNALVLPTYACTGRKYQRTALRRDAFLIDVGVGSGARRTGSTDVPLVNTYSECWNSPEIPFGLALWDVQTMTPSGAVLGTRRMTTVRAGKFLERPAVKSVE